MSRDATFQEGQESPLRLKAMEPDDLQVISSLVQDSIFPVTEMTWDRKARRFALLLNRFRWEDRDAAERLKRNYERVQCVLVIEDVQNVASQGFDRADRDLILSLLSVEFSPAEDGTGRLVLVLAGDGEIAVDVECLEVTLRDVTRPYGAPSGRAPVHPE